MFPQTEIKGVEGVDEQEVSKIVPVTKVYEISAYTPYDETCSGTGLTASGTEAIPFYTCACNDLPFGTLVEIGGHIWTVEDRMGRDGCIDLCMSTEDECLQFGRKVMGVTIIER